MAKKKIAEIKGPFKVITLYMTGKGNKIFQSGDVIEVSDLAGGSESVISLIKNRSIEIADLKEKAADSQELIDARAMFLELTTKVGVAKEKESEAEIALEEANSLPDSNKDEVSSKKEAIELAESNLLDASSDVEELEATLEKEQTELDRLELG